MDMELMMLTQLKSYWFVVNENFEDTIGVIRSRKSKMDRQYNSKEKTDKKTNNDLHNTTQKTRDWVKRIPINLEVLFRCSGRVCSSLRHFIRIILAKKKFLYAMSWNTDTF
jgi:hypothetical protein